MRKLIGIASLCFIAWTAIGQTDDPYIEVLGSAEAEIAPNIIVISVRLKEYEENKVKVPLDRIEAEFLSAVAKSKVDKSKIHIVDITARSFQMKRRERDYNSQKTYEIEFSKTEDVIAFLDNLKDVKLDNLGVARLSHTEIHKYRLEVKIEALKAAQRKAEALLAAVGSNLGKPILIEEAPELPAAAFRNIGENSNVMYAVRDSEWKGTVSSDDIPLRQIKLRFEIRARFKIE